ncbi:MAG: ATP-binding protein [Alphaproteobacteria bacterium]
MPTNGLDVRTRLRLSFLAAVAFTVIASAIAVSALYQLRSALDAITTGHLPTIIAAFQLAQQSEATVASAPAMVGATAQAQRQTIYYRIRDQLAQIDELLIRLRSHDPMRTRTLEMVGRERAKLAATFETLNDMVEQRIASHRRSRDLMMGLTDLRQDLWRQVDRLDRDVGFTVQRDLGRALTLALDALVTVGTARHIIEVDALHGSFDQAKTEARRLADQVPGTSREPMQALIDRVAALGADEEGLFTIRKEELRATEATEGLVSIYSHLSSRLVFAVSELILHNQANIHRAADDSRSVIEFQTVFLGGLSGLCILGAVLIALHVRRNIIARLFDLQQAMVAGAGGATPAINAAGTDEISRMAGALEVFMHSRDQAEAQLRRAKEDAEVASVAKTRFLAAASHDLRQPLQALGLFVTALRSHPLAAEPEAIAERIENALESLRSLLDSLLDISKLEAGAVKATPAAFAVQSLLTRLHQEFEPLATAKGLRLTVAYSSAAVVSDPALLDRILRNLVANAIRYTDHGGVLIGCRRRGNRVRIDVWDTGRGIPEDQFEAVFREFHQLDNPSRDRNRGLGLGLAIVSRTAELLGHPVTMASNVGRGSRFSVETPRAILSTMADDPPRDEPEHRTGLEGRLVVVIEDEPTIRDGMEMVLESWGCDTLAVASADEAIEALRETGMRPDLVIVDYRLAHNQSGDRVLARLKAMYEGPVGGIIITGDTAPDLLRDMRTDGVRLLHKPVRTDLLHLALVETFAGLDSDGAPPCGQTAILPS